MRWLVLAAAVTVRVEQDGAARQDLARQRVERACETVKIQGHAASALFAPGEQIKLKRFGGWVAWKYANYTAGERLYVMEECLAAGANGFVWRASTKGGEPVAIKFSLSLYGAIVKMMGEDFIDLGVSKSQDLLNIANG